MTVKLQPNLSARQAARKAGKDQAHFAGSRGLKLKVLDWQDLLTRSCQSTEKESSPLERVVHMHQQCGCSMV